MMKKRTILLRDLVSLSALCSAALAQAGVPASSQEVFNPELGRVVNGQETLIIDERTMLKAYLKEVKKDSDADTEIELSKLGMGSAVFSEYNHRWWQQYNNAQRDQKIDRYWDFYYKGEQQAQDLMDGAVGANICELIQAQVHSGSLPEASTTEPEVNDAFRRGMVAMDPECFIPDLLTSIQGFDQEVVALRARLFDLQKKVTIYRPTDGDLDQIAANLQNSYIKATNDLMTSQIASINAVVQIDPTQLQSLQSMAQVLSQVMNCDNFTSREGRKMDCNVNVVPAPYAVDINAAYKILLLGQQVGIYQQNLDLNGLFEAVNTYLTEVNPNDIIVQATLDQMKAVLSRMDNQRQAKLGNLVTQFQAAQASMISSLSLQSETLWRDFFPVATQEQIIDTFFSLKERIDAYGRLELGTDAEAEAMTSVIDDYNNALGLAASISLQLPLPSQAVLLTLNDQTHTQVNLPSPVQSAPTGYLLGTCASDVDQWVGELTISDISGN
jgi:hypothetical protein